jgi:hypothetical protein
MEIDYDTDGSQRGFKFSNVKVVSVPINYFCGHRGWSFFIKDYVELTGAGDILEFAFTTPAVKRIHAKALFSGNAEFTTEIFETATISGGSPVVGFNVERDSLNAHEMVLTSGFVTTDYGDRIWGARFGDRGNLQGVSNNYEIIAKANVTYVWKITKIEGSTHYLDYDFFWSEKIGL